MKLIKPSFEIIEQKPRPIVIPDDMEIGPRMVEEELLDSIYRQIEIAGRTCYKSEDKITDTSAKEFVNRMVNSGHWAMLEHGTVYLQLLEVFLDPEDIDVAYGNYVVDHYINNPYSRVNIVCDKEWRANVYITTNYRVIIENNWLSDLNHLCKPTRHHAKRITVRFVTDLGILREFTRHRVASFAVESTRYCNYSKDKFNNELTYILPPWVDEIQLGEHNSKELLIQMGNLDNPTYSQEDLNELYFLFGLASSEIQYLNLINNGWKPQEARNVLPLATKCEIVMTAFVDDWWGEYLVYNKNTGLLDRRVNGMFWKELDNIDREKYRVVEKGFFPLRCSNAAHPQARELAISLREEFLKKGYTK